MTKTNALPRPIGATVLALSLAVAAALALPALSLAAPAEGSGLPLVVAPSPVTFPKTTVGSQSPTQEVDLFNEGEEEASIEKISIEGPDSAAFNYSGSSCGTLFQNQHCTLWISFMPGASGEKQAQVRIRFYGGRSEESFQLYGTAVPAHFSFHPGSYDFGLQPVHGESQRTTFQLENDGAAGVQFNSLNFTGNSNGFWFGNSNCYGRWMQPGESCSLEVDFGPSEVGFYATQLQASASNGESFTADLRGEGGRPVVEAFPNPADFGAATVGSTGATKAIVVHNSGNVPTGFFISIVAAGDSGSFQLLDENCTGAELMPAGSCTAHVRFAPQSPGPKVARLAFFGDSEGGTMVTLSGEGVAPAVTLAPSGYDFGPAALGSKSAPQSFAVRNEGSTPLDLGGATIVGADLDQFSLSGDDCSGATLDPGDECVVQVRFAPDTVGAKTARLRIGGDAGVFTASLAGTGVGSGAGALSASAAAGPGANAAGSPPGPRPGRHRGRHRRFVRGDAVASAKGRSPRRWGTRVSALPR